MQPALSFDCLRVAHESIKGRSDISFAVFYESFKDWDKTPVYVGEQLVGAILVNGPELHVCVKPAGYKRWFRKGLLSVLIEIIQKHGYAVTAVKEGNTVGDEFVKRFGFEYSHTQNGNWFYRMNHHGN